jgi:hypothetical protein
VFVEAVIVVTLTAFLLATGMYFHFMYIHKLRTMREAKLHAWEKAVAGCNGGASDGLYDAVHELVTLLAHDGDVQGDGPRIDQMQSPLNDAKDNGGESSSDAPVPALFSGWGSGSSASGTSRSVHIASATRVACNENVNSQDTSADAIGIFRWGWREFGPD